MNKRCFSLFLFSLFLIGAGAFGYFYGQSKASFFSATGCGLFLFFTAFYLRRPSILGYKFAFFQLSLLTALFSWRFWISHKPFMGWIALLSLGLSFVMGKSVLEKKARPSRALGERENIDSSPDL